MVEGGAKLAFELRPYQNELMNKTRKHLSNGTKGVLIQSPPRQR